MNYIVDFIFKLLEAFLVAIVWGWILYALGYAVLWTITLGRYPKGLKSQRQTNVIAGAGFLFLMILWFGLAGYNNFVRVDQGA